MHDFTKPFDNGNNDMTDLSTFFLDAFPIPIFNQQPTTTNLYQTDGKLEITGAQVDNATQLQWQKLSTDGTVWTDITGATSANLVVDKGAASHAGKYRLLAVNGDKQQVSAVVDAYHVYLHLQNDSAATGTNSVAKLANNLYNYLFGSGTRYFGAFYRNVADGSLFIPPGATSARAYGTVWTTSNAAVAPATTVADFGQLTTALKTGTASLTATNGNLSSTLNLIVGL